MGRVDANPDPQFSDQTQFQDDQSLQNADDYVANNDYQEYQPPPPQDYSNYQDEPSVTPPQTQQQDYSNYQSLQSVPPQDVSMAANGQQYQQPLPPQPQPQAARSLAPQQAQQPQAYPPQQPAAYPPQQAQQPQPYPPQKPAAYPPQQAQQPQPYPPQKPAAYPPQQAQQPQPYPPQKPAAYPPQQPTATYPPQPKPVAFPPPSPQTPSYQTQQGAPQQYPPGPGTYNYSQQQQAVNYGGQVGYQTPPKMGAQQGIPVGSQYLAPTEGWSTDLFACMDDPENALITACFPCVTFGQIAEIVDNGQTSCATSGLLYGLIGALIGIPCLISCSYRTKIRSRYGLMETPGPDWVTHFFCEWCALCQEYRELRNRGMDPAIGWQGNMAKNQVQTQQYPAMNPPMNQTMMA